MPASKRTNFISSANYRLRHFPARTRGQRLNCENYVVIGILPLDFEFVVRQGNSNS